MAFCAILFLIMFYSQIVLTRGIPLDLHLPAEKEANVAGMTCEDLNLELQKGIDSLNSGKIYSPDEVAAELFKD